MSGLTSRQVVLLRRMRQHAETKARFSSGAVLGLLDITERLNDELRASRIETSRIACGVCGHERGSHSSGGMCDGDGSECYCVRFPEHIGAGER